MIVSQKDRPSPQALRIIELCHLHPGSSVSELAGLAGMPYDKAYKVCKVQRNNANMATFTDATGKKMPGRYVAMAKGRAHAGIDTSSETTAPEAAQGRTPSAHYTRLVPIRMDSHRPGAWNASAIERRGLPC